MQRFWNVSSLNLFVLSARRFRKFVAVVAVVADVAVVTHVASVFFYWNRRQ